MSLSRIGLINGCFDGIHVGHINFIRQARSLCDRLIVLINSDRSVRRLKGPKRPLNSAESRLAVLLALTDVDDAAVFDSEDDLADQIKIIRPALLIKGEEYRGKVITGAELLKRWNGKLIFVRRTMGVSTTDLARIAKSEGRAVPVDGKMGAGTAFCSGAIQ